MRLGFRKRERIFTYLESPFEAENIDGKDLSSLMIMTKVFIPSLSLVSVSKHVDVLN